MGNGAAARLKSTALGGRYGSPVNGQKEIDINDFYIKYNSITKFEYESACEQDVPIYILIDKAVYIEYETYKNNRKNDKINYAHVDSINVFLLIDQILKRTKNNPIYQFERHAEIEQWLREQWAGLFKEMLSRRSEHRQLKTLAGQVNELANYNTMLKNYLEKVMPHVTQKEIAESIIDDERKRFDESKRRYLFEQHSMVKSLQVNNLLNLDQIKKIFTDPEYFEQLAILLASLEHGWFEEENLLKTWKENTSIQNSINEIREILGLKSIIWQYNKNKNNPNKKTSSPTRGSRRTGEPARSIE
jgi:hypothetical protein